MDPGRGLPGGPSKPSGPTPEAGAGLIPSSGSIPGTINPSSGRTNPDPYPSLPTVPGSSRPAPMGIPGVDFNPAQNPPIPGLGYPEPEGAIKPGQPKQLPGRDL